MSRYVTVAEYRQAKGLHSSDDDEMLEEAIDAIEDMLDRKLNNPFGFVLDAAVTTRVYAKGDRIVPIADTTGLIVKASLATSPITWATVTALVQDTDFELTPLTPADGHPYTGIRFYNWATVTADWRFQVTAIHGWPEVPKAIKRAVIEMVAMLELDGAFATGRISEGIDTISEVSGQARQVLKSLSAVYNPFPVAIG